MVLYLLAYKCGATTGFLQVRYPSWHQPSKLQPVILYEAERGGLEWGVRYASYVTVLHSLVRNLPHCLIPTTRASFLLRFLRVLFFQTTSVLVFLAFRVICCCEIFTCLFRSPFSAMLFKRSP